MSSNKLKRISKHLSLKEKELIVRLFYFNKLQFERSKYQKLKQIACNVGIYCEVPTIRRIMINWQINRNIKIAKIDQLFIPNYLFF